MTKETIGANAAQGTGNERTPERPVNIDGLSFEPSGNRSNELIHRAERLLEPNNSEKEVWEKFYSFAVPRKDGVSLYERLGLAKRDDSDLKGDIVEPKHVGLVEHNLAVGAGALWLATVLGAHPRTAFQGGVIQDAGLPYYLGKKNMTREELGVLTELLDDYVKTDEKPEDLSIAARGIMKRTEWSDADIEVALDKDMFKELDTSVIDEMWGTECTEEAIAAALNTGRLSDRYIRNSDERKMAIKERGLESNIVSYVDAMTIKNSVFASSLEEARDLYLQTKRDPKSQTFFKEYWFPYFKSVEEYLVEESEGKFDPSDPEKNITKDRVFGSVVKTLEEQSI